MEESTARELLSLKPNLSADGMDGTVPGSFNSRILIPNLIIILSGLAGLVGNAVVFWLLGFRLRRTTFSVYILNLAAADVLFLGCHVVDSLLVLVKFSHPDVVFLPCFTTVMMVPYIAGLSLLSAISTERCLSVLCPVWYRCRRPARTSAAVCALLWALATLFGILNRYFCGFLGTRYQTTSCLASNFATAACLMVLFVVLLASSAALLARLLCGAGRMKLTRLYVTILLTVLVFLLCGLPFGIHWFLLIWLEIHYDALAYGIYLGSLVLSSVNSCANPIIYFFVGSFRQQLKKQTLKMLLQRALQDSHDGEEPGSSLPNTLEMSVSKVEL